MIGARTRHRLALVTSAALLAVAALGSSAGTSLAGPRDIFFGSPGHPGTFFLSPVQTGEDTAFQVLVRNDSGQTVNHAAVLLGDAAGSGNLTAGATFDPLVLGPDAGDCEVLGAGRSVSCDYGQLRAGEGRLITVVIDLGLLTSVSVGGIAQINETQGTTNPDTFAAAGSTTAFAPGGDKFGKVLGVGQTFGGATAFGVNGQRAAVSLDRPAAAGDVLGIVESVDVGAYDIDCAVANKTCIGQSIQLVINFGEALEPDAVLTVTWADKSLKIAGILHELDDGTLVDIVNSKANACKPSNPTNCILSAKSGKDGYTLVVRIPENGYVKGYR